MNKAIKYASIICIIIPIILLLYVYYRSEYYHSGNLRSYYWNYYLILFFTEIFFVLFFFLREKLKIYFFVVFGSVVFSLYIFEFYILFSNGINIFSDYKKYYFKPPIKYINEKDLFLLSLTPNKNYISSNENGYFASFSADRYGFNNPDNQWDKSEIDIILVGDSFVEGVGVNRPHDIASVLRNLGSDVLSLGLSGYGPLKNYAVVKEYLKPNHKKVFYLHYEGNDLTDLKEELKNNFLTKYLDKNFKQNLYDNNFYLEPTGLWKGFLKIFYSRKLILGYLKLYGLTSVKKDFTEKNFNDFEKVLSDLNKYIKKNNSEFYFVYLPERSRYYVDKDYIDQFDQVMNVAKKLNIPIIDMKEVFSKEKNVMDLFAQYGGHYSHLGYKKVATSIDNFLK
tara:strand:- start:327 stop:1511 length:1185 start_codon:yes stop_codon:yes gene_type:complete